MLRSLDINSTLLKSEKKTLFSFLLLYSIFTILLLGVLGVFYFNSQKDLMLQKIRLEYNSAINEHVLRLKYLHVNFEKERIFPRNKLFESAIFDSSKKQIFSTFGDKKINFEEVNYLKKDFIYIIKEPESYYLGTKYLVFQIKNDHVWLNHFYKTLFLYGSVAFLALMGFGYFLLRLLLKPMSDAIELLDRFIKDTTHELNTPVNAIMSNIEMIDKTKLDEKLLKKIKRIDIGARTVSNLYQDLTYLILSHKIVSHDEDVNLAEVFKERIEYFALFTDSKKLHVKANLKENISLHVDRKKITKLIDNLFSNAIKYNKIGGSISIILEENNFFIKDSGRGIEKNRIDEMFERYKRVDTSVGGFGIGLNIVSLIAKEYNLKIKINSQLNEYTQVQVSW